MDGLPRNTHKASQVFPIDPKRIEGHEEKLTASEHQVFKLRTAVHVQADNLSVKHCVRASERSGYVCRGVSKGCEGVSVAGDEATFTVLHIKPVLGSHRVLTLLWRSMLCGAVMPGSYEDAPNRRRGLQFH